MKRHIVTLAERLFIQRWDGVPDHAMGESEECLAAANAFYATAVLGNYVVEHDAERLRDET